MFNSRALLVKFFCLFLLVVFASPAHARKASLRAKNVKTFQQVIKNLDQNNYAEATKLLDNVENMGDLNNLEKLYLYNFRGQIALDLENYEESERWYAKSVSTDKKGISEGIINEAKGNLKSVQEIISTYRPNYNNHKHLLKRINSTTKITDDHYTLALAAFKLSKGSDAGLILSKMKSLHKNQAILPERWMNLEASLTKDNDKKLELKKQIAKHYPNKSNRQGLSRLLLKNAKAAFKKSDLDKSRSILKEAENLLQNDEVLTEKWMVFKTVLGNDKKEKLELWKNVVKHYPSKSNQRSLAGWYVENDQEQEAYAIYIKLYNQGKLTTSHELQLASHCFSGSGKYLEGTLVLAKGFKENTILDSKDHLTRYELYFAEAKKDKTITAQEWLDAGDKFVLYSDKDKAKVCFKKAKKDKTLRDVAKQRLKELKQS